MNSFPFSSLVPGTFRVEASSTKLAGVVEEEVAVVPTETGFRDWTTVYRVIPYERKPDISAKAPGVLRTLRGRRAVGTIVVSNSGELPLEDVTLSAGSRSFLLGKPARTSLEPGRSTSCPITFLGRSNSAVTVRVSGTTPDRQTIPDRQIIPRVDFVASEDPEEGGIEPEQPTVIPGETVSTTVRVRGVAVNRPTKATIRRNSPRFPRGLYGRD